MFFQWSWKCALIFSYLTLKWSAFINFCSHTSDISQTHVLHSFLGGGIFAARIWRGLFASVFQINFISWSNSLTPCHIGPFLLSLYFLPFDPLLSNSWIYSSLVLHLRVKKLASLNDVTNHGIQPSSWCCF